jgi:Asp-tRNA(Asn)/Glu-tRNA(Gln) amidotransferase A subunit family amidase
MERYDFLLTPTTASPAFPIDLCGRRLEFVFFQPV